MDRFLRLGLLMTVSLAAYAQTGPVFDVATIKPSQSVGASLGLSASGVFTAAGTSLSGLIKFTYDVHPSQIIGGPSWVSSEKFDVTAKPDKPGRPPLEQLKAMVRKLMADRFQLAVHQDQRELSVYAIRIAKSGLKLKVNDSDPNGVPGFSMGARSMRLTNSTMTEFAHILQASGGLVDRPVVDETGLGSARYDFAMTWTPISAQGQRVEQGQADGGDAAPDFFTAFQEQLGLRLEPVKAAADVVVIDRVEKPSEN